MVANKPEEPCKGSEGCFSSNVANDVDILNGITGYPKCSCGSGMFARSNAFVYECRATVVRSPTAHWRAWINSNVELMRAENASCHRASVWS